MTSIPGEDMIFVSTISLRPILGHTQTLTHWPPRVYYPGVKWSEVKMIADLNTRLRLRIHGAITPSSKRHGVVPIQAQRQFNFPKELTFNS
jgi:hypothetical protein